MDNSQKQYTKRTDRQNRALHKMFQILADELNGAGLDQRKVLKPAIDIPWSRDSVKNQIWRPVQKAQLGKKSTTELTTVEIDQVFDTINKHLGERFGLHVPFPSIETILINKESEKL